MNGDDSGRIPDCGRLLLMQKMLNAEREQEEKKRS
jgi:hypothetical protein